jgi:8-oxo-dGTP pyrophosphatase MutT (NUDIX family)
MQLPVPVRRLAYRVAYWVLAIYWFVMRPQVQGVKCVLTDADRVLLVRHTYGRRDWDLPGGSIKRDEPPLSAARREMHEELGLSIDNWVPLGELFTTVYKRRDTLHCFQAELRAPQITIDRGEIAVAEWFPRRALPQDIGRFVTPILARSRED